jgi:hypothetical protein
MERRIRLAQEPESIRQVDVCHEVDRSLTQQIGLLGT